ncbi:caspase-like [Strongylocentrotus purpuratus]|uniref:Uncharacterized protein n=1 Tax=Strongylocentrotus purpuratus TaxID=7668 RepID=A0A7M7P0F4_STRPU|nr:caspase-like [Strongylocentrotus purpuratus]
MEQADRETLQRNNNALSNDMDFESVASGLVARGIFEEQYKEWLDSRLNQREKNMLLLMEIETRGPRAFTSLVDSLIEANQEHLAELLGYVPSSGSSQGQMGQAQAKTAHENRPAPFGQPTQQVPEGWPPRDSNGDYSSTQMGVLTSYSQMDSDTVYRMKSRPRGIALIINNKNFETMEVRAGTDVDCRNLENVFKQLGFDVIVHNDVKGGVIRQVIEQLRKHNHSQFDCFIFTILTHGEEGKVYGTDGCLVRIQDIIGRFSSDLCPTLNGKPKLFFVQACRGGKSKVISASVVQRGCHPVVTFVQPKSDGSGMILGQCLVSTHLPHAVDECQPPRASMGQGLPSVTQHESRRHDEGVQATDGITETAGDTQVMSQMDAVKLEEMTLIMEPNSTDSVAYGRKVPSRSDMLIAYATVTEFVSWRDTNRGSWFIQALTEVFLHHAKDEDLLSMMTMVNDKVARAFESATDRHKQMPAPVTMLRKKLFFFPGHYE